MKKSIVFYLVFFLYGISLSAQQMEEGIIEVVLNNSYREESFPAYFGEGEYPLIEIDEFAYMVGLTDYEITSSGFRYRINGEWNEEKAEIIDYEGIHLVSVEDVSKDEILWNPDTYVLNIDLPFELPGDFLMEREKKRRELDRRVEDDDLVKEDWKAFTPGVLKVTYGKSDLDKGTDYTSLNYVNQFAYGASELNISGDDGDFDVDTYRWKRHIGDEREVVIGDSFISTPSNLGDSSSFRGLSIFKRNSWDTSLDVDNKTISGFAPNGIVVELYENGILREYQVVRNGRYEFEIETTGGNRNYEVWLYQEDGEIEKKPISIYGSIDLLDAGEVDFDFQIGQDRDNSDFNPYNANVYYGITEDFTMKAGGYNTYKDDEEKHYLNIGPTFRIGSTGNWSHLVVGDYSQNSSENDEKYQRAELQSSNSDIISTFGYEKYKGFDIDEINESYDEKQYWRATFPLLGMNGSLSYEREKNSDTDEKTDRYGMTLYDSFFRGKVSASGGVNRERVSKGSTGSEYTTETDLSISYNVSHKNLKKIIDTIGVEYDSESQEASTYGIYFRRRSRIDRSLEYYLSLKKEEGQSFGELTVSYKLGDRLNIRSSNFKDKDGNTTSGIEVNTAINFGAPGMEKIYYSDYMGDSNVAGQVFIDANNNGIMDADEKGLSDFSIKGNSRTWNSNEDGEFFMPLLSSNTHYRIDVKNENTDILNYKYEKRYNVRTLPGGELQLYIPVVPLKSLVGIIEFDEGMYIEEVRGFLDNTVIKIKATESSVEETIEVRDEYFMRDLPVGRYSMEFVSNEDMDIKGEIHYFEISADEDEFEEYIDLGVKLEDGIYKIEVY